MTIEKINKLLKENAEWIQKQGDTSPVTTHILETLNTMLEWLKTNR